MIKNLFRAAKNDLHDRYVIFRFIKIASRQEIFSRGLESAIIDT